jgi:RimJ/RimL family protein N-acetyltransferase
MSLEYAIEKFPCQTTLKDGTTATIRLFDKKDEPSFHKFFMDVPECERLFIKERLTEPENFHRWCENLDLEVNLPILLVVEGHIAGVATLHQRQGGWKRNIGLVSSLTHPDHHGNYVAKILVAEQIQIARHLGLIKLEAEFNGEREVAIRDMAMLGFEELAHLPDYLQDMQAQCHDYVLMGMDIITSEEYTGGGD